MHIERITAEDFEMVYTGRGSQRRKYAEERTQLLRLPKNAGMKMVCKYPHYNRTETASGICAGAQALSRMAFKHGFKVRAQCKDSTLYVWKENIV